MNKEKAKLIAYWVTTIFGPASFVMGGSMFLTGAEQPTGMMQHLGYPAYLLKIIGTWKILGAIACMIPGTPCLKEWAYAGFFFLLTGAAASHFFAGDPFSMIFPPLLFLAITMASYCLRPASRRLR